MSSDRPTRLIKWLGDPKMVREDGRSVANWRYENRRSIALWGYAWRLIEPSQLPGLSRAYKWDTRLPHYCLEVDAADAVLILQSSPHEFRDVTHEPYPETVRHEPIVMLRTVDGKIKVMQGGTEYLRTKSYDR